MTQDAIKLEAQSRSEQNGKAAKVRKEGFIPATVYGSGSKSQVIKVKEADFSKVFNLAGESHLINLSVDGGAPHKVIVKDIQKDYLKGAVIHIDFFQVNMTKKITTEIPLNFIGESRAVKELGGTLIKNMDSLTIECLPGDLVDKIDVDLSALNNIHDAIKINDLVLPKGVELDSAHDEIVVSVIESAKEEVKVEAPAAEATEAKTEEAGKEKPAK